MKENGALFQALTRSFYLRQKIREKGKKGVCFSKKVNKEENIKDIKKAL